MIMYRGFKKRDLETTQEFLQGSEVNERVLLTDRHKLDVTITKL